MADQENTRMPLGETFDEAFDREAGNALSLLTELKDLIDGDGESRGFAAEFWKDAYLAEAGKDRQTEPAICARDATGGTVQYLRILKVISE